MERRKGSPRSPSSPLPVDFLKMVVDVFASNFDAGLKELRKHTKGDLSFSAEGAIYADEILLAVSLIEESQLAATTVYASSDFDPKASAPSAQDLLAVCVDGIGAVLAPLLDPEDPKRIALLAEESLSALDDIPFEWTSIPVERRKLFVRIDKANPKLEALADDWLRKHDPELSGLEEENEAEAEKLFVTGPGGPVTKKRGSKLH